MMLSLLVASCLSVALANYCQAPLSAPKPEGAAGMTLVHVSILHRHGDRTPYEPVSDLDDGVEWKCGRSDISVGSDSRTTPSQSVNRLFRRVFVEGQNALRGNCQLGQLTSIGVAQHRQLGAAYRAKYVHALGFLPATLDPSIMWFRSTNYERTLNSLQSNVQGLYPAAAIASNKVPLIDIHTRDQDREYLTGGDNLRGCPKVASLLNAYEATGAFDTVNSNLDIITQECSYLVGTTEIGHLRDNALARGCHNLPGFKGYNPVLASQLKANYTTRYYLRRNTVELQKFSIGPLFNNIVRIMKQHQTGNITSPKWSHYSGHDSTLVSVNAVLQRPKLWPAYASHVEFELWAAQNGAYYVQIVADGAVIAPFGQSSKMMPFQAFVNQLQPILISEDDWRTQCMQ